MPGADSVLTSHWQELLAAPSEEKSETFETFEIENVSVVANV